MAIDPKISTAVILSLEGITTLLSCFSFPQARRIGYKYTAQLLWGPIYDSFQVTSASYDSVTTLH